MHLTYFSDYALRLALYLAAHADRRVSIEEVSRAYGISPHHLVKVVQLLSEKGIVATVRGRSGGVKLNVAPEEINVGALVRLTEPHFHLVECFDAATNTCPIAPACGLKGVFREAQEAFLDVLDRYSLAEFLPRAPDLIRLWTKADAAYRSVARDRHAAYRPGARGRVAR
jgi:Rrf2 family nitric oxide-sensitive transcriptional repressor